MLTIVTATSTRTSTPTASPSPTYTPSPSPTLSPPANPTTAHTPQPPRPTITPTLTTTPTLRPTLTPTPLFTPTPLPTMTFSKDIVHFLLIGIDYRADVPGQNTDVMIVAVVNKNTKQVSLLSIPRDLWVYIPTYGWSRINTAHRRGYASRYPGAGPGLLMRTIEVNLGIPIDHWVRVTIDGFREIVDALGGVDIVVACPVNLRYKPPTADDPNQEEWILQPGVYHMDGDTAVRYVRTRRGTSDFDRARRQQQFLRAVWQQTKNRFRDMTLAEVVPTVRDLWSALRASFETDMNVLDVLSLVPIALDLQPQHIRNRYIGAAQTDDWTNADGWQVLLPNHEKIQQVVASLYAPPSASENLAANEKARIQVLNGTLRHQWALIAADQFRGEGLTIVSTGLADRSDYQQSQIIVFNPKPETVQRLVRVMRIKPESVITYDLALGIPPPDPEIQPDIRVILGSDYDPCR
jgi:polyisoprenyl-teichoic acid--peptidoglycan teichoic acid transferase